ncbi:MAG: hypothetical protein VYB09_02485 [Planctomycetota bacterium]|nr:hypothetical protein [Planctomycetota bacterium]
MADSQTSSGCSTSNCCGVSLLGRAFGVSISIPVLILAVAGLVAIPLGWHLGGMLFVGSAVEGEANAQMVAREAIVLEKTESIFTSPSVDQEEEDESLWSGPLNGVTRNLEPQRGTISGVYTELLEPATKFFDRQASWNDLALYTFGGLWTLLVYALFGGAISRIAVVQLGRGERVSLGESLRFSIRKLRSYFMAPLFVIIASLLLALLITIPSLLMRAGGWGTAVVGVGWVIVLILAAAMAVLLVVLSFGWPLMWGAISAEETGDVFEATSRSFSYTIQRPLKYACYVVVALIIGGLGWWLVDLVANQVTELALWSASWGGGLENVAALQDGEDKTGALAVGTNIINFLNEVVGYLVAAYTFAFFWAGSAAIYLLLRKDTDQTELDDVYMPSEEAQFELPQLHQPTESENAAGEDAASDAEEAGEEADAGEAGEEADAGENDAGEDD